jgi:hypothetical protein
MRTGIGYGDGDSRIVVWERPDQFQGKVKVKGAGVQEGKVRPEAKTNIAILVGWEKEFLITL